MRSGMKGIAAEKKGFMITVVMLVVFGIVITMSASISVKIHNGVDITTKILANVLISIISMALIIWKAPIERWKKQGFIYPAVGGMMVLLLLPILLNIRINGAYRWISFGVFSLQPAELAKIVVVTFLAYVFSTMRHPRPTMDELLPIGAVTGLIVLFIFMERDLGLPLVIAVTVLVMLFVTRTNRLVVVTLMVLGLMLFAVAVMTAQHRRTRAIQFWDRKTGENALSFDKIPDDQVGAALLAVSSAGLKGKGLGNSETKFSSLTEAHNDFVFSLIIEELGLAGFIIVVFLFTLFMVFGLRMAFTAQGRFEHFFLIGMVFLTISQAVLHMMVNVDMLPAKGFGLPFVSYGGSSMVSHMILVGLAMTVKLKGEE
ncbi:MAG: hypothetical protein CO090_08270 [Acidobacteria bacterium CG_4_9_14_3_um_filter_49_7]|nr:MAG: hypothetical protein CO090_08270 [Acidobacteria bacterium CG_4_9_14_3_um_filter_49_7]